MKQLIIQEENESYLLEYYKDLVGDMVIHQAYLIRKGRLRLIAKYEDELQFIYFTQVLTQHNIALRCGNVTENKSKM